MTGGSVVCFWLEPIARVRVELRRYSGTEEKCPKTGYYCNASVAIGDEDAAPGVEFEAQPQDRSDPHWPKTCDACGRAFVDADTWQVNKPRLHSRSDGGAPTTIREAPLGAMWDCSWLKGVHGYGAPDGRVICVKTPGGDWVIDGPSSNGNGWTRTGDPPKLTARPSIAIGEPMHYHAFLTAGVLVPC